VIEGYTVPWYKSVLKREKCGQRSQKQCERGRRGTVKGTGGKIKISLEFVSKMHEEGSGWSRNTSETRLVPYLFLRLAATVRQDC